MQEVTKKSLIWIMNDKPDSEDITSMEIAIAEHYGYLYVDNRNYSISDWRTKGFEVIYTSNPNYKKLIEEYKKDNPVFVFFGLLDNIEYNFCISFPRSKDINIDNSKSNPISMILHLMKFAYNDSFNFLYEA